MLEEINEQTLEDYLAEPKHQPDWHQNPDYKQLLKNIRGLQLDPIDHETLKTYRKILLNRWRVQEHDATVRL